MLRGGRRGSLPPWRQWYPHAVHFPGRGPRVARGDSWRRVWKSFLISHACWQGFYWPTALQDAAELVKSCKACQFHAKQIHTLAQTLQMIPPSWPFAVWGVDILGPFPQAVGGYRFLYVAIDKFTKWPEVTP